MKAEFPIGKNPCSNYILIKDSMKMKFASIFFLTVNLTVSGIFYGCNNTGRKEVPVSADKIKPLLQIQEPDKEKLRQSSSASMLPEIPLLSEINNGERVTAV